jgi:hypothetical protein
MGAMKPNLDLLDVVELREARGGHAAGTVGAIVELFADEIVNETGATSDLVRVPLALQLRRSEPAERRATG